MVVHSIVSYIKSSEDNYGPYEIGLLGAVLTLSRRMLTADGDICAQVDIHRPVVTSSFVQSWCLDGWMYGRETRTLKL